MRVPQRWHKGGVFPGGSYFTSHLLLMFSAAGFPDLPSLQNTRPPPFLPSSTAPLQNATSNLAPDAEPREDFLGITHTHTPGDKKLQLWAGIRKSEPLKPPMVAFMSPRWFHHLSTFKKPGVLGWPWWPRWCVCGLVGKLKKCQPMWNHLSCLCQLALPP